MAYLLIVFGHFPQQSCAMAPRGDRIVSVRMVGKYIKLI